MVLGLNVLVIILAGFVFLFFNRFQKAQQALKITVKKNNSYEETLNRLVHDAINPLSTTAMALHNLSFVLKEQNANIENQASVYEFLNSAHDAIEVTNKRLKETILFTRTDTKHFKPVNIIEIAESVAAELDPALTLITGFDDQLPMLYSDPRALRLVFSYLFELSLSNARKQIIHFKLKQIQSKKNIISCAIFNHHFLGTEAETAAAELKTGDLNDSGKTKLAVVERILSFHNSKLTGSFEKQNGGYWTFSLIGIKE